MTARAPKCPNNVTSTFFSSLQYISGSNMGAPNLLLVPAPSNLITPLIYVSYAKERSDDFASCNRSKLFIW